MKKIISLCFIIAILLTCKKALADIDLDGNGIHDQWEQVLANKFCPCFELDSRDGGVSPEPVEIQSTNFLYMAVFNFLGQYALDTQDINFFDPVRWVYPTFGVNQNYSWHTAENTFNYTGIPPGLAFGTYYIKSHLGFPGDSPGTWRAAYADEAANNTHKDRIYANLWKKSSTEYVIQYWFFYPFNDCANKHEGDWEHINVIVSNQDPSIASIVRIDWYFHHKTTTTYTSGYTLVNGTHPVVFVGGYVSESGTSGPGSHGSYPIPGIWNDIHTSLGSDEYVHYSSGGSYSYAGRYIPHNIIEIFVLPHNSDGIDYNINKEMSWFKANIPWGNLEVNQLYEWVDDFTEIGNNAPPGPYYNAEGEAWHNTGVIPEHYDAYTNIPPQVSWTAPSVQTPPSPPVLISYGRSGSQATLTWTNPSGNQGTKIYYSTSPRFDRFYSYQGTGLSEGNSPITISNPSQTSITLHNLGAQCYYFALRSYNGNGESWFSNELLDPLTTSGTLTHNETWSVTHTLTGNVTVPSGIRLTILSGTTLNFSGSSYLTVQSGGSILALSTVTFNPGDRSVRYSGTMSVDNTWGFPILLTNNLTVSSGKTLTILSGTTVTFTGSSYITVQSGGSIVASSPITFNPGDRSVRYSGTISVNNTWAFPVLMTNNVTVNSGKMLTILPGSLIKVYSGKKLTINGTIIASGTASQKITFQANSGTWYGIEVNYGGNTAFNYCNIKNATCGIRGYQTSNLTLDHCEITNNTNGVTYTNQSSGYVRYSKINSNLGNSGINCAQNSNPIIRPNNQLKYNAPAGLYGDYNSLPEMGSWANNGNNSISNSYDDVWSENSNSVYALYNYWGSSSPNPSVSDNIEWEPYLTSDPNGGSLNKLLAENPGTADRDTTGQTEFARAYQAYLKEDYALAIPLFQEIVQKYPDHTNGGQALGLINQCYQKTEKNTDALSYLEQVQNSFTAKKVSQLARSIAVGHHVRQGDYATAIANCEQILAASTDSALCKYALYDLGNIYWYFQDDPKIGEQYYRQLIKTWPKDQLAQSALATLGEGTPDTPRKPQPADAAAVVTDHLTLQTFPNPFNPITAIQFNLPEAGKVTMTIYDLQGRQIARLLDEPREAGLQIVHWNGQNGFGVPTASGTYFCKLQFKNQVLNQKIILLK